MLERCRHLLIGDTATSHHSARNANYDCIRKQARNIRERKTMPYVAHAAFPLNTGIPPADKGFWRTIKRINGIEYRWKFAQDCSCHVLAGVFDDPNVALACAKQIHVTLFYELLRHGFGIAGEYCGPYWERPLFHPELEPTIEGYDGNETFFFWNKHYIGRWTGPGAFEVTRSIDEFDDYQFMDVEITGYGSWRLDLANIDQRLFEYCHEAQDYLDTILLAENAGDDGLQMTIYCGLLDHLSESEDKDSDTLEVIDQLIECVEESSLPSANKSSLKSLLNSGRKVSSRQQCRNLCAKYAKPFYDGHPCKKIIDDAYGLRSAFSHGTNTRYAGSLCSTYMKFVVLDVVENYMKERRSR